MSKQTFCCYDNSYSKNKGWESGSFGVLDTSSKYYYDFEMRRIGKKLNSGLKVLEIGFGNGSFLKYAESRGWDITGTEVNEGLVSIAKSKGFKALQADNLASVKDNTFDLVIAFDVLEHIAQDKIVGFLAEIRRVLNDGGVFLARFPNGNSPFSLVYQNGDITHVSYIGTEKAKYFASKLNMTMVFLGGEAEPLICGSLLHVIHRIFALPIKAMINFIINLIFFPRSNVFFCSSNLVMILSKIK